MTQTNQTNPNFTPASVAAWWHARAPSYPYQTETAPLDPTGIPLPPTATFISAVLTPRAT